MKLANLNSAIRSQPGIMIPIDAPGGRLIVRVIKADLLYALKHCFNEDRNAETFLKLDDKGYLVGDGADFPPKEHTPGLIGEPATNHAENPNSEGPTRGPASEASSLDNLLGGAGEPEASGSSPDLDNLLG